MSFDYNDYEILYLIREGNEAAYQFMFEKYEVYIRKITKSYCPYGARKDDFLQEGRMVLFRCIESYRPAFGSSFFSFFSVSLKRELIHLTMDDYYHEPILCEPNEIASESLSVIYQGKYLLTDPEDIELYRECILENESLTHYAKKRGISYHVAHYRYISVLEKIRKKLTFK